MSINSVQKQLLGTSFLDTLAKSNISDSEAAALYKELPELVRILAEHGAKVFFINASKIIQQEGLVSSGDLQSLLDYDITTDGGKYTLSVGYKGNDAFYWKFVNYGVKGIRSGRSLKGFSFKTANPSKKMVDAMVKYIGVSGSKVKNISQAVSAKESKEITTAEQKAWMLATLIKRYGIKPREYMERAAKQTFDKNFASKVAMAVGKDIKIFIKSWQ